MEATQNISHRKVINIQPFKEHKIYGTIITYHNSELKLHFETEVSFSGIDSHNNFLFELNKKQVYINNEAPKFVIDKLADAMGKVLYPLIVSVDADGFVNGIANYKHILTRWPGVKEKLQQYYKGNIAEDAIAQMERSLQQENILLNDIKNDWFIALFFSGIYGLQPYNFRQKSPLLLPVISYAPMVQYAVTREITEQHTQSKSFIIICKGKIDENRSAEDIMNGNPVPVFEALHGKATIAGGEASMRYLLYHKDFSIRSVTGKCSFTEPGNKEKNIGFEIYHLPEKDKRL